MRKILFAFVFMCVIVPCAWADVAINSANFPDDNFRSYVSSNFDTDSDGVLSDSEIANVDLIDVNSNGSIASLKGIEYFTALTNLDCNGNQLTALDVSSNTALTSLSCHNNQLTALDVSSNTALTWLWCSSNQLTALNVSNNTALTHLACYDNQITALDVSNNTALTELQCGGNQLAALDVRNNTALTSLDCHYNQLTALDLSSNTALTSLEFSDNQLTALDLSKNTALTYLNCSYSQLTALDVSNNTALTELHCDSDDLTVLDVSSNTALKYLYCDNNQLTALDVSSNTALLDLVCHENQLTALDVSNNTALLDLTCRWNQLTAIDVSHNTALTSLNCADNQLTTLDVNNNTALTDLLCSSQTVSPLTIASTGNSSYPYQLNFSAYMSSDKFANVSGVQGIDSEGSIIGTTYSDGIAQFTDRPAKVTYNYATGYSSQNMDVTISDSSGSSSSGYVAIDSANFPDSAFRSYVSSNFDSDNNGALSESEISAVDWINVSNMNITSLKGIEHFTQISGLNCENIRITELDLSRNTALTEVWAMSSDISSINVNNCTSLRKLGLHGNKLTSLDVSGCYALEELHCGDMSLSRLVIGSKPSLRQLYCYRNQLAELDVTGCPALTQLHFGGNRISSIDLSKCTALQLLHCWSNLLAGLDLSGLASITDINCADNALRMLDLSGCTSLANVEIGAQSFDAEEIVRTGDANYPYRVNLSSYVTAGNLAKISEVYAYDSSGSAIDVLLQNGTVLFASLPATISYVYDTGHGNMNVSVRYARASVIFETPSNVTNPTDDMTSDDTTTGNQTHGTTNRRQIEVNGRRYALYDIKMSWVDAKSYCESLGGNLAAITTQEEQDAILSMILSSDAEAYWLGGRKIFNGLWSWLDGSEWSYANWDTSTGQPDNSGEQLLIYGPAYSGSTGNSSAYYASDEISRTPGKWGSVSGNTDDALYGFICEWDYKEISVATVTPIPEQYMPGLAEKLAQLVSVDKSEINFITSADIDYYSDPREPTQAMREALSRENGIFEAKLNTIKVSKDGWYAFLLTVSDDLVGTNVNDLRLYYAEESEFDPLSVSASFGLMPVVNGIAGGFEITDLFGVKLDTVPKQFIAMMLLTSGKSLSVYIVKILLVLLAGCSAGAGSLIFLAVFIYKKHFRKK